MIIALNMNERKYLDTDTHTQTFEWNRYDSKYRLVAGI